MTLDQLRVFLEVARQEHVTKAAKALNLTQSAVSASVAALEARHAVVLFNRVGRHIELTEAGRLFVPEAEALLKRAQAAELLLADLGGVATGTLHVFASQTVASYWLPSRLVRFRELYPRVAVALAVGNTAMVAAAVLDGSADIGVVEGFVEPRGLAMRIVAQDRLVLLVSAQHPWADGRPISHRDLRRSTWVMREKGSGTRAAFESELHARGVDPEDLPIVLELPSNEAALAAVEAGLSATVLSERVARHRIGEGRLYVANFDLPARSFSSLRHAERHATKAVRALLDLLDEAGED